MRWPSSPACRRTLPCARPGTPSRAPGLRHLVGAVLLVLALTTNGAGAVDRWNVELVGSLPGYLWHVQIAGTHAFGATGSGLLVLDVTPGRAPAQTAFLPLEDASLVAVDGDHAYVAAGEPSADAGLNIVDVSDPRAPVVVGRSAALHRPTGLIVRNGLAYVADKYRGLRVIDVADPAAPVEVGFFGMTTRLSGLDLVGTLAYLADEAAGLCIVDVSHPSAPVLIGSYDPGDAAHDVAIDGQHAYLACAPGLRVVDVSRPDSLVPVGSFTCAEVTDLARAGHLLYLSHHDAIRILDLSDPPAPSPVSVLPVRGRPVQVAIAGPTAYVAAAHGGLRLIDVLDPAHPAEIAAFDLLGDPLGVTLREDRVYLAGGYRASDQLARHPGRPVAARTHRAVEESAPREASASGLYIVDLADRARPAILAALEFDNTMDVGLCDSLACVTDWGGRLGVVTVADPLAPRLLSTAPTGYWTTDLAVDERYAYVLLEHDLWIFDLADPTAPLLVGSLRTGTTAIAVQGNYAYALDYYYGLSIVDISDRSAPTVVGTFDMPNWAEGVAVAGRYAYIANGALGLRIIDVLDPTAPREAGTHDTPGYAVGVAVDGDRVGVADREGGVRVFSVTDPTRPEEIGYYVTTSPAEDVAIAGDDVVAGCSGGGLFLLKCRTQAGATAGTTGLAPGRLEPASPNPFAAETRIRFTIPSARPVKLSIVAADGRVVARLIDRSLAAGTHVIAWSGRDARGADLPAGTYFYRLEAGDLAASRRLTRIR